MKHIDDIAALIRTLQGSKVFHALLIQSPPGWAKSSTIEKLLKELKVEYKTLGSYSTPLSLYNALNAAPDSTLVIDDCAGLFGDTIATVILKAATWSSVGSDGVRRVSWASTSDRVSAPSFIYSGKLILLTNTLPGGKEMEAFLSRTLYFSIAFERDQVATMLREAAQDKLFYENTELAIEVANHLAENLSHHDHRKINLRTLQLGYELAKSNPQSWRILFGRLLPNQSPKAVITSLETSEGSLNDQIREFMKATGKSRRTFFNYKRKIDMEGSEASSGKDVTA